MVGNRGAGLTLDFRSEATERSYFSRLNRLNYSKCIRAVALADAIAIIVAAVVAKFLYIDIYLGLDQSLFAYVAPAPLLALTLHLFMKLEGFYEPEALNDSIIRFGKLWGALAMSMLVLVGILYLLKVAESYSRGWFLTWGVLSAGLLLFVHGIAARRVRELVAKGRLFQRFALFGNEEYINALKKHLEDSAPSIGVVGVYTASASTDTESGIKTDLDALRGAIERGEFETVVVAFPASERSEIQRAVKALGSYSSELLLCTDLDRFPVSVLGSRYLGQLKANVVNLVPHSEGTFLKSMLDYIVAIVSLILLAPLFAIIAIAIKLDSKGPVLFTQRRYGRNNRIFRIFKFRTMTVADDGDYVKQAERDDARVTRVGWFLRRMSLDEVPQILNVLKGDMSIVGPRPHALAHDHYFERQIDLFSRRRRVRPGMTGWAQVHGLRGETRTTEDMRSRMQHDLYYIDNWSIWLDIEIITRTIFVLFRGAY